MGLGCTDQRPEDALSSPGNCRAESEQHQSIRPYGGESAGHGNRFGLLEGAPADIQNPPLRARTFRRPRITIRAGQDHVNVNGTCLEPTHEDGADTTNNPDR